MKQKFTIRPAVLEDTEQLFSLILALADYEKLSHAVTGNSQALQEHLFGEKPCIEAVVADCQGEIGGFALFFSSYSTFLTKPGIYLEDLFVLPPYRGQGMGKALLSYVAQLGVKRGVGRLEWSVLDWNQTAIAFYEKMGATVLPDWRICRVTDENLVQLADKMKE